MRLGAGLSLKTQTCLSPHMVLACNLLRASSTEIEERIEHELRSNPALEREAYPISLEDIGEYLPERQDMIEQLLGQLRLELNAEEVEIAEFLVNILDIHGFLKEPIHSLADELGIPVERVEGVVHAMHRIDPPGIGARNVQECLLIQLSQLEVQPQDCLLARRLLTETWDEFTLQRWKQAAQKLDAPLEAIEKARDLIIGQLRPYPLRLDVEQLEPCFPPTPDVIILRSQETGGSAYKFEFPQEEAFEIRLSESFASALYQTNDTESLISEPDRDWMCTRAERARLFAAAIRQRWATLRRVCEALIRHQKDYLDRGPLYLRPLTRATIAKELGLHESTVSRAVQDKIVQLPDGRLMDLSNFFDHSMALQETIRRVLTCSERPLNDQEISERLKVQGFALARRTVAKYRKKLNIKASYQHASRDIPEARRFRQKTA